MPSGNLDFPLEVSPGVPVVAIGDSAFADTELIAISLPSSVETIGAGAFSRCKKLAGVNLGGVKDIGGEAFKYCEKLTAVVIPNSTTNIAGGAFSGCAKLSDVTIGSGVAKIGDETRPHILDEWGYEYTQDFNPAFDGCDSLQNFKLADGNAKYELIGGCLYYRSTPNNAKTLAVYPTGRSELSFSGDITVTAIGEGACSGCCKLTNLTIPSSVRNIGVEAFAHCEGLTSVVIPDNSVTNIEFGAFAWNMNVMDVEVAGCVKTLGEWAFMHCFGPWRLSDNKTVGRLVLHDGIETIGTEAFHRCFRIGEIIIPDSVTSMGDGAFGANRLVRRIVIGSGLDRIGDYAFQSDWGSRLSELVIGPNVKTIGDSAFEGCESLRVLNIPEGVTWIGDYAFMGCKNLCALNLPDFLGHIGVGAFGKNPNDYYMYAAAAKGGRMLLGAAGNTFDGCDKLRRVLVPLNVEYVGSNAFSSVTSERLEKIYLPFSLRSSSDEETQEYLESLFPERNLGVDDVAWYEDASDLDYVTVMFDPNNGGVATSMQVLDYVDSFPVPTANGYAFAGWWTTSDDSGKRITPYHHFTTNTTCYAHWIETPLSFGEDAPWTAVDDGYLGEMVLESGDIAFGYTSSAALSVTGPCVIAFSYINHRSEWGDSNDLKLLVDGEEVAYYGIREDWTSVTYELVEAGVHTVTWRYENTNGMYEDYARIYDISAKAAVAHTLTFHLEGGTMSALTSRQVISSPGKLPMPAKSGVIFAGWYTAANGGERFMSSDTVDGDLDLYARWLNAPFSIGGDGIWYVDEDGSYRSTAIARGQSVSAETSFTGPCRISFDWKVNASRMSADYFTFYIDGIQYTSSIGGVMDDWADVTDDIDGEGEHVFRWVFNRSDYSDDDPDVLNCAWLNNISIGTVCAITFDENYEGGLVNTTNLVGTLGELPVPKRNGYVMFNGWFTQREGGVQVAPATPVTGAATYYAHWKTVPFIFDDEPWVELADGSWMSPDGLGNYRNNDVIKEFEGPCEVTFKWKFEADGYFDPKSTFTVYDENYNALVTTNASTVGWVDETVTFDTEGVHTLRFRYDSGWKYGDGVSHACIKDVASTLLPTYDVTFAVNYTGGSNITRKVMQANPVVGEPPLLRRSGHAVNGWWTAASGGERISADTTISVDTTYYAHWVECPFEFLKSIPWVMGPDGEWRTAKMATYSYDYGASMTVQGPCRIVFDWKKDVGSSGRYMQLRLDDVFNDWCDSTEWTTKTVTFAKSGSHTILWDAYVNNENAATTENNCFMVRNLTVTPLASYTVTFNPNYAGSTNTMQQVLQNATLGETPLVFRPGYALIGWFTAAEGGTEVTAATVVDGDITVYAHWMEVVSFDSTGGDAYWRVEADGSLKSGAITHSQSTWAEVTVMGPCRVSFMWKTSSESNYDKLHLYVDGSSSDYVSPISGTSVDWAKVAVAFADNGSHAVRWTYTKDNSQSTGLDCGWVKDIVIAPIEPCTVTFDSNYPGGASITRSVVSDEAIGELPSATRFGYAFVGWFTDAEGGTQITAETVVSANMTVYARWEEHEPEITYELHDSYGDGWNGAAITVINVATESVITNLTIPSGNVAEGTIPVVGGMQIRFEWTSGSYDSETSYLILGVNGEEIVSGSGVGFSNSVVYTVPGGAVEPPLPVVEIDDTKMEEPVMDEETGVRTIAAKDGQTLTQADVESITITATIGNDPTPVDTTAGYTKKLVNNEIVVELKQPEMDVEVDVTKKTEGDVTGILADKNEVVLSTEEPTPSEADIAAGNTEVAALPVKTVRGLYYQASWGSNLNGMTLGQKVQATGSTLNLGVVKQTGTSGFYKFTVSEK